MLTKVTIKRSVDIIAATSILVCTAPLCVVVALLIKLGSPGAVFFRQTRLGQHGKTFLIWKFRTMVEGAVTQGPGLATFRGDPRITRIGAWLRKYRIDELPQMINVLRGDMSLIGPRPLVPDYLHAYTENDRRRLFVKPGVTGWQQVNGGSRNTWEERIALDLWYVDNWTLLLDLTVLLRTILVILKADGVYGNDGWQRSGCPTIISQAAPERGKQ